MNYLSDNSYLAIKPEATAGTAVIPTVVVPLVSENIRPVLNHTADRRMKSLSWKSDDLLRGARMYEGELIILADPDNLAHFLNMTMTKGSTTGDATDGYTHPFTVGDSDSYTIEIKRGLYAQRFFGVKINELTMEFDNGRLQFRASIKARGQFSVSKLGVALAGSVTSMTLGDTYDIEPNRGLVVGDVIVIGNQELTLTSVDSGGQEVGFTSTSLTYSVGEPIYLKPITPSLAAQREPLLQGNMFVGFGADASAAATAAATRATATPTHDFSLVLRNNMLETPRSGSLDPVALLPRTKEAQLQLKQLLENENQSAAYLHRNKQAICIIIKGEHINPDFSTIEQLKITLNKVKLVEHADPLEVGEYIMDDQNYEVLYDSSDGQAMDIEVINTKAGTVY